MMILEYHLTEQDFLDFQLYTASKSERINKKKKNGWIILTLLSLALAVYSFTNHNTIMAIYFGALALVTAFFYPKYFKWRYKRHYQSFNRENYSKRFNQLETLVINHDHFFSKDKFGEGKINFSEIEKIDETPNHFFVKTSMGTSILVPKREVDNVQELKKKWLSLGLSIQDETQWAW